MRQLRSINIISFSEHDERLSEECLRTIGKLPHLEALSLTGIPVTRESLECLVGLTNLKYLSLWRPGVEDEPAAREWFAGIAKLPRLEHLHLEYMTIDGEGLRQLTGLTKLRSLSLAHLTDGWSAEACLEAVGKLTQLEYLHFRDVTVTRESLVCLGDLTNLKSLSICSDSERSHASFENSSLQRQLLTGLPTLPRLEALHVHGAGFQVSDADVRHLTVLPRLRSLGLALTNVSAEGVADLASLSSLEELVIDSEVVSPAGPERFLALKRLKKLHLCPTEFGDTTELALDDGDVEVPNSELDGFLRVLTALRKTNPDIVIDSDSWIGLSWSNENLETFRDFDVAPPTSWLPTSDGKWMTAAERAHFEANGGWARFDAAGWGGANGSRSKF